MCTHNVHICGLDFVWPTGLFSFFIRPTFYFISTCTCTHVQLVAGDAASSLAGHTGSTQAKSYSSFDELGSREVIRVSHAALGENSTLRRARIVPTARITEQKMRHSMDDVLGCKSNYTCDEQKRLIQFATNEQYKHCIGSLGCGMGKSMAIWVHVIEI